MSYFCTPLKSENQKISDVFRGGRNKTLTWNGLMLTYRSSQWRCSVKKSVLENFTNFTGKHLKKRFQHRSFPVKFAKFLRAAVNDCFCTYKRCTWWKTLIKKNSNVNHSEPTQGVIWNVHTLRHEGTLKAYENA